MTYQWQFNTETGAFKNHALSRDLYIAAVEKSVFMDHVIPIESFGKSMGESVTLTRIRQLAEPSSSDLTEGIRIPEDEYAMATTTIVVNEIGRSVPYTSLSDELTWYDLENSIQRVLRDQMALSLDTKAAAAYKNTLVKYQITGLTSGTFTVNGSFGGASTENMNVYHVEEIHDYLFDNLACEPLDNDDYIAITRTLGYRGLMRDPDWEEWHKYTDPSAKFNGEVGRIENIRFIKTNHANALGEVGTGSVLGETIVFGQDAVAMAEVQTPELRAGMPGDFGRDKAVAWYGILNFGVCWPTGNKGEAKIIHVGST
jgi:N4-gp56 family major capsid protein